MNWVILIAALILGAAAGIVGTIYFCSTLFGGTFRWVEDEDGVYPYIEGSKPFYKITENKYVIFKVAK